MLDIKARFDSKPIELASVVKTKKGALGYVTRIGEARVRRNLGKVEVYFPERKARGYTFMRRSIFLANFIELVEEEVVLSI